MMTAWTRDPERGVWYARTAAGQPAEVALEGDVPPGLPPEAIYAAAATDLSVRVCGHPRCILTVPHAHGNRYQTLMGES
jgi:hypothetical protein